MVLDANLLNTQHCKVRNKSKWSNPRKRVAPSPTHWCSSYGKGNLWVTLDYIRYIYIIIIHRLFRCIPTLRCKKTREILQAEIETRSTWRQSDILPHSHHHSQRKRRNFLHIRYRLPGVLNSWKEQLYFNVCGSFPTRVLNQNISHIYIYIYIIKTCRPYGFLWLSFSIRPYHFSLLVSLLDSIQCPQIFD